MPSYSGDSYNAVQAAELQDRQSKRDSSQRSLQMLLGVMANRKQQEMQEKQLALNAQATAESLSQRKQEFAINEDLDRKRLMADAAKLDFDRSQQTFDEMQAEDDFLRSLVNDQQTDQENQRKLKIGESQEARLTREMDSKVASDQRKVDLEYQDRLEVFQDMSAVADKKNRKLELERAIKESDSKNPFYRSTNKESDSMKLELKDVERELTTIASDKRYANVTKWDPKAGKYGSFVPVMTKPERVSSGASSEDQASKKLFGGSPEEQYSEPAGPDIDPRRIIAKQLIKQQGLDPREAALMADRIIQFQIQQAQPPPQSTLDNSYRRGNFGSNMFPQ